MCSLRFHRMWNCKADLLFFVCRLDTRHSTCQTHEIQQKQHHVELTMDLVPMASSLPLSTKMYYISKHKHSKLRVAAFSGPPVSCFHQKCVKMKNTYSSLDIYFWSEFWSPTIVVSTAEFATKRIIEVHAVLCGPSTVKLSQNRSSSSIIQWTGFFSCAPICSSKKIDTMTWLFRLALLLGVSIISTSTRIYSGIHKWNSSWKWLQTE
jgi:hypothetical protein